MENGQLKRGLQAVNQDETMAKRTCQKKSKGEHDSSNNDTEESIQDEKIVSQDPSIPDKAEHSPQPVTPNIKIPKIFNSMRLEAMFYPKFENEQKKNQRIREQMKERVSNGEGYLEASIKHSGSLILWSGGERFYSKNSTNNVFTACAEILLRQHFVRAYWSDSDGERMFRECSDYVETNRITLAFEIVTSFLGDHGDRPNKDFLILTAVAVKSASPYFMPTFELVEFAQKFRLPHNDAWIFSTPASVDSLFSIYDNSRETGLASTINPALSSAADVHVSSLYPHEVFQGDTMEGIVIRYVPSHGELAGTLDRVQELARVSIKILENIVSPSLGACPDLLTQAPDRAVHSAALRSDLRKLYSETEHLADKTAFHSQVMKLLEESKSKRKTLKVNSFTSSDITDIAETLKHSADLETKRIAGVVLLLASLKDRVQYALFHEESPDRNRWLCIVHVLFDRTFPKYRKQKENPLDMELFRGFCIELVEEPNTDDHIDNGAITPSLRQRQEEEPLMLKMKLLPYMIRTFCCRNGLATIKSAGPSGFLKYCENLLSQWGISRQGRETWQPFLGAWGEYASAVLTGRPVIPTDKVASYEKLLEPQGPLDSRSYLEHIFYFTQLYHAGLYSGLAQQWDESDSFRGLLIVVGPDATSASSVADFMAHQLNGAKRLDSTTTLDKAFMERSIMRGGGHVLSMSIVENDGGTRKVRELLTEFRDVITVVLFDLVGNKSITAPRARGVLQSWQRTDFAKIFIMPAESLIREDGSLEADEHFLSMVKECAFNNAYDRPGILVFFPQIPGCGKSCLTSDEDHIRAAMQRSDILDKSRKVVVMAGDQIKDKYWSKVKHIRIKDTSSVVLADKNAPTMAWASIGQVCEFTQAIAVPVIPEDAVETTEIVGTRSFHGNGVSDKKHVYPYSLAYLAVCMARVLERPQGSHAGKLDRGTKRACIVVLQFYSMYRNMTAEQFKKELQARFKREGASLSKTPIQIPFFRSDALVSGLPSDLQEVLSDGLKVLFGSELEKKNKKVTSDEDKKDAKRIENEVLDELEGRLREVILSHRDYLLALTVDEEIAKEKFISQLNEKVAACTEMLAYDSTESKFIKLASLDVNRESLIAVFKFLEGEPRLHDFVTGILGDRDIEEFFNGGDRKVVAKPHVTLAHFSELSQADLHEKFDHLQGLQVSLSAVALYWNADNVALEVKVGRTTMCGIELPSPQNDFTHITVWVHDCSSAVKSNQLPGLVKSLQASKFEFSEPFPLEGSVSLWDS